MTRQNFIQQTGLVVRFGSLPSFSAGIAGGLLSGIPDIISLALLMCFYSVAVFSVLLPFSLAVGANSQIPSRRRKFYWLSAFGCMFIIRGLLRLL